jgi:heptosyltransferase-1
MYGNATNNLTCRILVVRMGAMGDVIHALPAVASLKHAYPGCKLTWVIEPRWAPLLEDNPFVDRVVHFNRREPRMALEAWREIRTEDYDFAVDFQGLLKSALVAAAAHPDHIFGFHHSLLRERLAAVFYSVKVQTAAKHVVDRNLDLAKAAGAGSALRLFPLPDGEPQGTLPNAGFVLACPMAGWRSKQWPLECYGDLARMVKERFGLETVLNGPAEARSLLAGVPSVHVNTGDLRGLIYATRRAAAVVGVDSGPLHLAAALGKPGVGIYGPTDPTRNGPYRDSFTVLRSPHAATSYRRDNEVHPSMREISPAQVFAALSQQLCPA